MYFIVLETEKVTGIAENEDFLSLKPLINRKTKKGGNKQNLPIITSIQWKLLLCSLSSCMSKMCFCRNKLWRELPQMWFLNPQVGVYTLMWKICEQQHVKYFTISKKKKSQHAEAVCKTLNTPLPLP